MKKIVSLILAGGLICSALFAVTGCSDNNSDNPSSKGNGGKYQEVFDAITDCDVESSGASMKILQTNFYIKNWVKEHGESVSGSDAVSDTGSELSNYISQMSDKEKTEFGIKCQAVVDAELKIDSTLEFDHAKSWGADVQNYSMSDISNCGNLCEAIQDALSAENIKPSAEYPSIEPTDDMSEKKDVFDEATFLELIYSMASLETATAGSSYQLSLDTGDFMQFVIDNSQCSEKDMKTGVEKCYNMLTPGEKLTFDWNFSNVLENIDVLIAEPTLITDMGISVAIDDFSNKDLNKLVNVISDVSGVSYTYNN